jgi:anti-sigma factor RsiW
MHLNLSTTDPDQPARRRACDANCSKSVAELAEFIDGGLAVETRHLMEAHLTTCEACRWVVASTVRLQRPGHAGAR